MKVLVVLFSLVAILMVNSIVAAEEDAPSVAVQAEPFVDEQVEPIVGEQAEPFVGEQAEPFVGEQAEPFVGDQSEPIVGEQAEPFVGEGEVKIMERISDAGQVESRSSDVSQFAGEGLNVPILTQSCSTDTCTYICRLIGFQKGSCQSNSSCYCSS